MSKRSLSLGAKLKRLTSKELTHVRVEIERVPIGRTIEVVPSISQEGDTTIIPVVEEIVVVERRLVLKEEVRIRRVSTKEQHQETVVLRQREVLITREEADRHSNSIPPTLPSFEQHPNPKGEK